MKVTQVECKGFEFVGLPENDGRGCSECIAGATEETCVMFKTFIDTNDCVGKNGFYRLKTLWEPCTKENTEKGSLVKYLHTPADADLYTVDFISPRLDKFIVFNEQVAEVYSSMKDFEVKA